MSHARIVRGAVMQIAERPTGRGLWRPVEHLGQLGDDQVWSYRVDGERVIAEPREIPAARRLAEIEREAEQDSTSEILVAIIDALPGKPDLPESAQRAVDAAKRRQADRLERKIKVENNRS